MFRVFFIVLGCFGFFDLFLPPTLFLFLQTCLVFSGCKVFYLSGFLCVSFSLSSCKYWQSFLGLAVEYSH